MENKAHYALIGAFVLVALLAGVGFVAWLSNAQFDQQYDTYEVSFSGGVSGLSQGSEVRFNGLNVGEVTRLRIDPQDSSAVLVDIQVVSDTPVDTKSFGQLQPLGLTGLNFIQIQPGGVDFPLIKDLPGKGPRRIEGRGSQIDQILGGGGNVIEEAQKALARVNVVLGEEAIADFHGILDNINRITTNLRDADIDGDLVNRTLGAIEVAATDVASAAKAVDVAATDFDSLVQEDVKSAIARAKITMDQLDQTLASIGTAADGTDVLITDARDAINRLSNSGLTDLEETVDGIRRLVLTLGRVADSLEKSPVQFIVGEEKETVELPQ